MRRHPTTRSPPRRTRGRGGGEARAWDAGAPQARPAPHRSPQHALPSTAPSPRSRWRERPETESRKHKTVRCAKSGAEARADASYGIVTCRLDGIALRLEPAVGEWSFGKLPGAHIHLHRHDPRRPHPVRPLRLREPHLHRRLSDGQLWHSGKSRACVSVRRSERVATSRTPVTTAHPPNPSHTPTRHTGRARPLLLLSLAPLRVSPFVSVFGFRLALADPSRVRTRADTRRARQPPRPRWRWQLQRARHPRPPRRTSARGVRSNARRAGQQGEGDAAAGAAWDQHQGALPEHVPHRHASDQHESGLVENIHIDIKYLSDLNLRCIKYK